MGKSWKKVRGQSSYTKYDTCSSLLDFLSWTPSSSAFLCVQTSVLVALESVLGSCHFHTGKVSIHAHQHIGWAGLTIVQAAMAAAMKAGSFRLDKYKSNGISVELIRTRMEDLALECQKKLRGEHVSERTLGKRESFQVASLVTIIK